MGYTTLSIRQNNRVRKYILFYADYLNEAWLSEVLENDTTKIVRQYRCKDTLDFQSLVSSLSKMGEIVNLNSDETVADHLAVLEMKLERPFASKFSQSLCDLHDRFMEKVVPMFRQRNRVVKTA